MRVAAEDLYAAVNEARGSTDVATRTVYGRWLAAHLSADLTAGDLDAEHARADALSFRSDRLRELAAVPAVVGLLVALLTTARDRRRTPPRTAPHRHAARHPGTVRPAASLAPRDASHLRRRPRCTLSGTQARRVMVRCPCTATSRPRATPALCVEARCVEKR